MKNPFKVIDEKLREKYWYSARVPVCEKWIVGLGIKFYPGHYLDIKAVLLDSWR